MNLLAHAYLSFGQPAILTGNMISDFVKGRAKLDYPAPIQTGITLHRLIDQFTDSHPVTREAKQFFRKDYRLYAGAFIDVVYDHFLANDDTQFKSVGGLKKFTQDAYASLAEQEAFFPPAFKRMFPYMVSQNWLFNYRLKSGMQKGFGGLVHRAAYIDDADPAFRIFNKNYEALGKYYSKFFPDLKNYSFEALSNLQTQ